MMPKGVEHAEFVSGTTPKDEVKIPMMPKGVEHFYALSGVR